MVAKFERNRHLWKVCFLGFKVSFLLPAATVVVYTALFRHCKDTPSVDFDIDMDLYGDLPPASGEAGEKVQQPILGSAWSLPLNNSKKSAFSSGSASKSTKECINKDFQNKVEQVKTSSSSQSTNVTKMTPSSLIFKPRQTACATTVSRPQASFTIKQTHSPRPEEGVPPIETMRKEPKNFVSNTITNSAPRNNQQGRSPTTNNKSITEAEEEFNTNDSFDVIDAYDPRRPNDYLAYCQERKEEKRLQQLALDNQKQIAENEKLRAKRDRERQEAAAKGDYLKLLQQEEKSTLGSNTSSALSLGRGRGRGLSNLPAWMTQQIAEQGITTAADPSDTAASNPPQQFQDINNSNNNSSSKRAVTRPSSVLLLMNMVSIEEVDRDLELETQRECEKFGPVKKCLIHVLKSTKRQEKEEVRVFVQFMRQDAAVRAFK